MRYTVLKEHKRLRIFDGGVECYVMPDFVQVPNRAALQELADCFNRLDRRDIDAIVKFETNYRMLLGMRHPPR